jgi:hypothetical protein
MNEHYYEVVLEGNPDFTKGFVMGFLSGRGISGAVFFDQEYHFIELTFGKTL